MITVVQENNIYIIRFPYNPEIIQLVKNVPGRAWNAEKKYWTIPIDRLGFLINQLKGTPYEGDIKIYTNEQIGENNTLDATVVIPDVDISKLKFAVAKGSEFFPHQKDFMKYAIDRQKRGLTSGFILADCMGCGKTLEVTNLALYNRKYNKLKHCLIICCVNSAKFNWVADIEKHTNGAEHPYILGTRLRRDGSIRMDTGSAEKLEDLKVGRMYGKKDGDKLPFFIIMNIEAVRMKRDRHYLIRERLTELVNKGYIGMIALDEVHSNCLHYDALVETNSGKLKIGDIVNNKLPVKVRSFNKHTNQFEWRNIQDWIVNDLSYSNLIELTLSTKNGISKLICTPDHLVYTNNRGWVAAKDLECTDDIMEE